ncbi:hypothetical protein AGMMS4957_08280 [Bacteroidia bacterium]|nr:hypothetical protein AGMMS4957_08280 [Bacteroidia bacterium]
MKKKNFFSFCAAAAVCCLGTGSVTAATSYTLTGSGDNLTLTITGTGAMPDYSSDTRAPWYSSSTSITTVVINSGVTSIGSQAFWDCDGLTSVTIPNSVTSIEDWAFAGCSGLTSVTIPNGVTSIGDDAFSFCTNLTAINVDIGNTEYSSVDGVLSNKNQNSLLKCPEGKQGTFTIPNSVTSIERYAFRDCRGLTSVTIPNSVTSIGLGAFSSCSGLTSVDIPNSVTSIEDYAFSSCHGLESVSVAWSTPLNISGFYYYNSVFNFGNGEFQVRPNSVQLIVPESAAAAYAAADEWKDFYIAGTESPIIASGTCGDNLTWELKLRTLTISGTGAMSNFLVSDGAGATTPWYSANTVIKTVVIDAGVTSIGNGAFYDCRYLTSVTIPESVTSIGEHAFYACFYLTSVDIPNRVTSIGTGAFGYCSGLTSIDIPNSVTSIGDYAFYDCSSLTGALTIPDDVTNIGWGAFYGCSGLTGALTIPDGVTSIETQTFYGCSGLTGALTIPDGVTSIEKKAFYDCSGLTSVTVPNSVTSIGESVFYGCSSLTAVICLATTPPSLDNSNFGSVSIDTLYVSAGSLNDYQNDPSWSSEFSKIIALTSGTAIKTMSRDKIALNTTSNGVVFETKEATLVSVFNIAGQKVYQSVVNGSEEIRLNKGVYIVRVGNESRKVIVK